MGSPPHPPDPDSEMLPPALTVRDVLVPFQTSREEGEAKFATVWQAVSSSETAPAARGGLLDTGRTPGGEGPELRACGPVSVQFEAFCAGGLAPGWSLLVQGQSDSGEDRFEVNFLCEGGDIAFHVKPRFSSATVVGNAFQGGHWGQEEVSSVVPLALGQPFEMEVSSDEEHFHVFVQEHKVLQFPHRQRPLAAITRVRVLSDHRLAQVELARRGLSWGDGGY
ncbi:grifin [Lepus europaeus]|uniref:grifin n=1 Tax=Lepus europaeus TaxID=9983 RepID=UPI002B48E660|nr:grifin [Lepus europaeus]